MGLPLFKCIIDNLLDSELQVEFVSLVDRPAIEKNFLAYSEKLKFNLDTERRIISGPAMIADMEIYRKDETLGEYYTVFDKESILSIVQKFFKKGYMQNFNIMHDPKKTTSGITIFESFITDAARGVMPMKGFEDTPDGSWFLSAKVDDDDIWASVKDGTIKGFSVEGIFERVPVRMNKIDNESKLRLIESLLADVS